MIGKSFVVTAWNPYEGWLTLVDMEDNEEYSIELQTFAEAVHLGKSGYGK